MKPFLLVFILTSGPEAPVEVPDGLMATEALCTMAGTLIAAEVMRQVPAVQVTYTCTPAGEETRA